MIKFKILAVASIGGHWKELLCIITPTNMHDTIYASTNSKCAAMVDGHKFYKLSDFSRWDFYKMIPCFFQAMKIIRKEKPDVVVSTGAAPGLITLFVAKLLGKKTIWIDSVANVSCLSLSGKIASKFVSRTFIQWESLATPKITYVGNVLEQF